MTYLAMLKQQPQAKVALITDEGSYTYGELVSQAEAILKNSREAGPVIFIHQEKIVDQLLYFVAYSGSTIVPIIATEVSKKQSFELENIPRAACMGVMTSGSTGKSKLLWRSHDSWASFFPEQNRVFGIDEKTVIFCQGSLAFTGNLNIYMGVLSTGGTLVVTEKFRPKHWVQLIEQHQVNALYLIPSKLLLLPRFLKEANRNIRHIVSGSQTMGRVEADKLLKVFPNTEITLYYGASELNYITYIKDCHMTEDRTDIGLPFEGVTVEIRGEEIYIDNNCHVENIEMPFSLKDRGYLDEQGHLHFLGRTDDIISVNGLKVSSVKIETALRELPDIVEAAVLSLHEGDADVLTAFLSTEGAPHQDVVGLNNEKVESTLCGLMEAPSKNMSPAELIKLLKVGFLEDYEIPHRFIFLEELPKNESGKIDKKNLHL